MSGTLTETPSDQGDAQASTPSGDVCSHCGASRKGAHTDWCQRCGYYPTLGVFVELDEVAESQPEDAATDGSGSVADEKPGVLQGLRILVRSTPPYVPKIAAGVAVVLAITGVGLVVTPADSPWRAVWAIAQLAVATIAALSAHFLAYMYAVTETDRIAVMDMLLQPIAIWFPTLRDIRIGTRWRRVGFAVWGVAASALALGVLGGIDWEKIWEYGPKERAQRNLIGAVTEAAQRGAREAKDLEDALRKAEAQNDPDDELDRNKRMSVDCLVIGYTAAVDKQTSANNLFDPAPVEFISLLLATQVGPGLQFVGAVDAGFTEEDRRYLRQRLPQIPRDEPFVKCKLSGNWVQPLLTCRVTGANWSRQNMLQDIRFEKLLAEIAVPAP